MTKRWRARKNKEPLFTEAEIKAKRAQVNAMYGALIRAVIEKEEESKK